MGKVGRPGLSDAQKRQMWDRWRRGESIQQIADALGKHAGSIYWLAVSRGGFPPPERCRSSRVLGLVEREEISRGLAAGDSIRVIASRLERAPSTVSREIARHGGRERYRAGSADERAWANALRPKACLLQQNPALRELVAEKLEQDWSPEQISGWLARTFPDDRACQVSHETIYKSLFVQTRGVLKKVLLRHLRRGRMVRRNKRSLGRGPRWYGIPGAVSIHHRPTEVDDRTTAGHWEGDLITGCRDSHVATLVERHSRFVVLAQIKNKHTDTVVNAIIRQLRHLPSGLRQSLTWDRGQELAAHTRLTTATAMSVYFCDPSSPWQRGTNENTNGLLRQYLPKGADFTHLTQSDLDHIATKLNNRPRKTLNYVTPSDILKALLR
jgi:IS30 family transposase